MPHPRDALILEHREWAALLAKATVRDRLLPLGHDEAESAAMLALVMCARRWTPGPATFKTYARYRIVGSVYDELRHDRWWSHGGRDAHGSYVRPLPLMDVVTLDEGGYGLVELTDTLDSLFTGRTRHVLQLLSHGLTLAQVGVRLGVSEGRICQIRRAALKEFTRWLP